MDMSSCACRLQATFVHWEDIAQMMTNMSNAEWIATSDYKMRRFGDAPITIGYTNAVMELYDTYRGALE